MSFITDNYLWFLIGGGALILISIGYFAEQTNFGKKKFGERNDDIQSNENPVSYTEQPANSNVRLNDIYNDVHPEVSNINNNYSEQITNIPDATITSILEMPVSENNNNFFNEEISMNNAVINENLIRDNDINNHPNMVPDINDNTDIWKF